MGLYTLEFWIPALPPMNTAATRRHHMQVAKEASRLREAVVCIIPVSRRPPKPLPFAVVTMTRLSAACPDYGNLVMSFKPILDALQPSGFNNAKEPKYVTRADLIEDDSPTHIIEFYNWVLSKPGHGSIRIRVQERTGEQFVRDREYMRNVPSGLDCET